MGKKFISCGKSIKKALSGEIRIRASNTYHREPLYDAMDWNYIRFDCAGNQWELINGELLAYED
ncbi:MAG: hypothetical protein V3G42_14390 [Oscillospiraceae bacterium]